MTTQFADDTDTATQGGGRGRLSRIIGPVVDVEFPADAMPVLQLPALPRRRRPPELTYAVGERPPRAALLVLAVQHVNVL